jgi:predicted transcriptional regulator of viral defense system
MADYIAQIIALAKERGLLRARDLTQQGIPREYLRRMVQREQLVKAGRGVYHLPDVPTVAHAQLAEVAVRVPKGVICLLSALHFYDITTQLPYEIWLAVEGTTWKPRLEYPPLHVMRFTGKAFHSHIVHHEINGVRVPMYSIAKTVADCFKFRHKIGLDVALEALRETLRDKRASRDEIWQAAKVCRMTRIMRPYLEVL